MKKGVYFCDPSALERVYGKEELRTIGSLLDIPEQLVTRENWREHLDILQEAEVIVSTWGGPVMNEEMLAAMPNVEMYFYGAGDISALMTNHAWERGIRITSANSANAIPVAEFVLSQIIFSLKHGWEYMQQTKAGTPGIWGTNKNVPGTYRSKVGIISIGQISRRVIELLEPLDVDVIAYCQTSSEEEVVGLNVETVPLETIFETCDVITVHLRSILATQQLIDRDLLNRMKQGATLINTSRGSVIHQDDLIEFLGRRRDVYACIDVTDPEPPEADSGLLNLPNVVLTPHLAGSMGRESQRMAHFIIDEINRFLDDGELMGEVNQEHLEARI